MCYQNEKLSFITEETVQEKPTTGTLKKVTALLNQIKHIREPALAKIITDLDEVNLSNFLEDTVSSLFEYEGKDVYITMRIAYKLSRMYEDFNEIFLDNFKEILRKNLKNDNIDFYTLIYAEMCSCGIEKQIKYKNFLRKTLEGQFFKNKLKVLYSIVMFINEQLEVLGDIEKKTHGNRDEVSGPNYICPSEKKAFDSLLSYYRENLSFLREIYCKIEKPKEDQRYAKLLNNIFNIENKSDSFVKIVELSRKEKRFYSVMNNFKKCEEEKTTRLTTEKIIQNIRHTNFIIKNLTRNQRKDEFILSLVEEPIELKYLAKIAANLNFNSKREFDDKIEIFEKISQLNTSPKNLPKITKQVLQQKRQIYFACELFKFDSFDREKLISLFYFLLKTKKYTILINCIERSARFLLSEEYSTNGNKDIIKFLLTLNQKSSETEIFERRAIRNSLERITRKKKEEDNEICGFMEFLLGHVNFNEKTFTDAKPRDMKNIEETTSSKATNNTPTNTKPSISENLNAILQNNKLFLFSSLLNLWSLPDTQKLIKILKFFDFNTNLLRDFIFVFLNLNEKHKAINFAKIYGQVLYRDECNDMYGDSEKASSATLLIANINKFNRKVLFSSSHNPIFKICLVTEFLSPFPIDIKKRSIELINDFVEMNDDSALKAHYNNFCRLNDLPVRETWKEGREI